MSRNNVALSNYSPEMSRSLLHASFDALFAASAFAAFLCLTLSVRADWVDRLLVEPLEGRYQRAAVSSLDAMTGVIAISGDDRRFAEAGRLARLYPKLKVLISDSTDMAGALSKLGGGIEPARVILETKSRNTYENATFGAALLEPKPQGRWLLVTGALHMPRAVASFEKAGFRVEPWPLRDGAVSGVAAISPALHEWLGLVSYRLLGRTSQLLPM